MRTIQPIQAKAKRLIDLGLVQKINDTDWNVTSLTGQSVYNVTYQNCGGSCTCKGFRYEGWCYHIEAVAMLQQKSVPQSVKIEEELL